MTRHAPAPAFRRWHTDPGAPGRISGAVYTVATSVLRYRHAVRRRDRWELAALTVGALGTVVRSAAKERRRQSSHPAARTRGRHATLQTVLLLAAPVAAWLVVGNVLLLIARRRDAVQADTCTIESLY